MVSKARDDLPEPDTPVTTVRALCGISKSMFLRLWTRAPRTVMNSLDEEDILSKFVWQQIIVWHSRPGCGSAILQRSAPPVRPSNVTESFYYIINFSALPDPGFGRLFKTGFSASSAFSPVISAVRVCR